MKRRVVKCPGCGGPVDFHLIAAIVTVCEFCQSVVGRADKRVEDFGKVADLVETNTRLARGLQGRFENRDFTVAGRVQYQHPAGGVWDEWYLELPGNRVRWLAEAQGKLYIMKQVRLSEQTPLPTFDEIEAGERINIPGNVSLVVAEKGVATARSADGDIPWGFRPNAEHRFVDLHGPSGEFATIEYTDRGPRFYLGREITARELGLPVRGEADGVAQTIEATGLQLNCPKCAGPLALHVPDQTLRVSCPSCHALLDCNQGKLSYLKTLGEKSSLAIQIPLGSAGKLFNHELTVIGYMERHVVYEGKKYTWAEYLLYSAEIGFRWLVWNTGHWSYVEPVMVYERPSNRTVQYKGQTYRLYDKGTSYVSYVVGEFYWRVMFGERAETEDYIAPPYMLSFESSKSAQSEEENASLGVYVETEVLEAAFGLKELRKPWSVGVIQPQKPFPSEVWLLWVGFAIVLVLFYAVVPASKTAELNQDGRGFHLMVSLAALTAWPIFIGIGRHSFEVSRWKDSDYSPYQQSE